MTGHEEFATWDGAYVLGALSPADRRAYEEHLRTCAVCTADVSELAGLPGLLRQVSAEDAFALLDPAPESAVTAGATGTTGTTGTTDSAPDVLPALLSAARRRRMRTRWWTAGSLPAAAAIVAVSVFALPAVFAPHTDVAGTRVTLSQVEPSALSADVRLVTEPWGTRIESSCSYSAVSGTEGKSWAYAMVVTDRAGTQTQVATWTAGPGTTVKPTATTSVAKADIASIDIRSAVDGTVLLKTTFG